MEKRQENKLGIMPMGKLLVGMSVPLMISMLVQALYNIVDGIYVSQISEDALTAVTLGFPIQILMISVASGTGVGINALLSRRLGQKRYKEANMVATHGLVLAVLSSIIFLGFGLFASRGFIAVFTDDEALIEMGTEYLKICSTMSIGVFLGMTNERLLQVTGRTLLSMVSQLTGAIINIIFDPILIFGLYGFPEMGITGAALATVGGQIIGCMVSLCCNVFLNKDIKIKLRGFKPDVSIIAGIYKVGFPSMIMQAIGSIMLVGMNAILIMFSTTHVSVFGAYFKIQSFVFMPVFGLTQGLIPIIGYNYGARNAERIKSATKLSVIIAFVIMFMGTICFQVFPDFLLGMFNADDNMMEIGRVALKIISLSFSLAGISIVLISVFQGLGNGIYSLFNSFMRQLVVLLPAAFLLARYVSDSAVWLAFTVAEVVSLVITVVLYTKIYKSKIKPLEMPEKSAQGAV